MSWGGLLSQNQRQGFLLLLRVEGPSRAGLEKGPRHGTLASDSGPDIPTVQP